MIDFSEYYNYLSEIGYPGLSLFLRENTRKILASRRDGHHDDWSNVLSKLPDTLPSKVDISSPTIQVGTEVDLSISQKQELYKNLQALSPWRKGPFSLFNIHIDTEWRSDWKWARLAEHISPLKNRMVLDIGSGNGYYALRMAGAGAKAVVAIDPFRLYVFQFLALNRYIKLPNVAVLPFKLEDVYSYFEQQDFFDTVFSMGVLYHRRNPAEHLAQISAMLRDGGEAVLETIILDKPGLDILIPNGRYAKMRNVWAIPTTDLIVKWFLENGFSSVDIIDVAVTTTDEQRQTDWMDRESLSHFLDPANPSLTIEGYPAPVRAVFRATK